MSSDRTKRRKLKKELENLLNESNVVNGNDSLSNTLEISNDNSYCFDDIDGLVDTDGYLSNDPLSSSDDDEFVPEFNLKFSLAEWAIKNNITSVAVDQLLEILRKSNPSSGLPSTSKTLLKTPVAYQIQSFVNGQYYHFGIKRKLNDLTHKSLDSQCTNNNTISISLGIDGLPISRSSKKSFWPILGRIEQACDKTPFLVGLWFGEGKPPNCDEYLTPTVNELLDLFKKTLALMERIFLLSLEV